MRERAGELLELRIGLVNLRLLHRKLLLGCGDVPPVALRQPGELLAALAVHREAMLRVGDLTPQLLHRLARLA